MTGEPQGVARASLSVASWTVVSRVSGLARAVAIGAVLGPTYLGNTFQAVNQLPNLAFSALTGSLLTALLVPPVVRQVDRGTREDVERVAGAFMGLTMLVFASVAVVAVLAGPLLLRVLSLGVGNRQVAAAQHRTGWLLLALVMPQVVLYGIAGTGEAVQNAYGRFALAAAAPAFENVGIVVLMGVVAGVFGTGTDLRAVRTPELLVLGLGSTAAVTAHAGAQWWGAWRVGIRLRPRAGWRDADVRRLAAGGLPSLGYAALNSFRYFAIIVVANRVPGGVVAFQLAFNFMYVPVALGAYPVAVALLPDLSRLYLAGALQRFRDALVRGASLMFFLAIPAAVAAVFLAGPLSRAMAFGEMADARGRVLVAASLTALGVGLLGEAWWVVGTHAAYAREDARAPFRSMIVRIAVTVVGMGVAFSLGGTAVLVVLGLAVSAGNIVGSVHLAAAVRRRLPRSSVPVMPAVARAAAAALVMAGPAYAVAGLFGSAPGRLSSVAAIAVAGAVGASLFLAVQWALRSPELRELREGFGDLGRRGGRPHRP